MTKKYFFKAILAMLVFGMAFISCDDGNGDNNNNNNSDVVTPTSIALTVNGYIMRVVGFEFSVANSTLPGAETGGTVYNSPCGFSISSGGTNYPIVSIGNILSQIRITVATEASYQFSSGKQVTLSYTPNGTHIFKDTDGKTLGAFTLTGTAQ